MCKKKNKKIDEELHEMPKVCAFCELSSSICDEGKVLCRREGVVSEAHKCKKFRYDPLKRVPSPPQMLQFEAVSVEDL